MAPSLKVRRRAAVSSMCSSLRAGKQHTAGSESPRLAAATMPCVRFRASSCPPNLPLDSRSPALCGRLVDPHHLSAPKLRRFRETRQATPNAAASTGQEGSSTDRSGRVTVQIGQLSRSIRRDKRLDRMGDEFEVAEIDQTPTDLWKAARTAAADKSVVNQEVIKGASFSRHTACTLPELTQAGRFDAGDGWSGKPLSNYVAKVLTGGQRSPQAAALIWRKRREARHRDHVGFPVDHVDHILQNTAVPVHPTKRVYRPHGRW